MRFYPAAIIASAALACVIPHSAIAKVHDVGTAEPSEPEMREAVQHGFDRGAIEAGRRAMGCHEKLELAALMKPHCVLGSLSIAASPYQIRVTLFSKLDCAPAGKGEFWCRYHMGIRRPGAFDVTDTNMAPHRARFRKTSYGWIVLDS